MRDEGRAVISKAVSAAGKLPDLKKEMAARAKYLPLLQKELRGSGMEFLRDVVDDYHGVKVSDPYRWLEDLDGEKTRTWVEAQNEVTFGYLGEIGAREGIRTRLTDLWNYERWGLPARHGKRYVVQYPPLPPSSQDEVDRYYDLPFRREWHPDHDAAGGIPALEPVRWSVNTHRGCMAFGTWRVKASGPS